MLDEIVDSGQWDFSVYLSPKALDSSVARPTGTPDVLAAHPDLRADVAEVVRQVGVSDTGLAVFWRSDRAIVINPPFPLEGTSLWNGANTSRLSELMARDLLVGVILLRLGRYVVGVFRGQELVASKSGTRYVKSRHRAGGSSQRRFERSRERLVREMFGETCRVVKTLFTPFESALDYLILGGESHTLRGFVKGCDYVQRKAPITLSRVLAVERPGRKALDAVPRELWRSRVTEFTRTGGGP